MGTLWAWFAGPLSSAPLLESRKEDPLLKKSHIGMPEWKFRNGAQKKLAIIHRHPDFLSAVYLKGIIYYPFRDIVLETSLGENLIPLPYDLFYN
jgi:hypothetical protein